MPPQMTPVYTLCDTPSSVAPAVVALSAASHLAFDSEGLCLGEIDGKLSLITLAGLPTTDPHVYLFDALALNTEQLEPVFELLRSEKHMKVMFDGRMDFSEVFHRHGVRLAAVLDLQLADVESRSRRGESFDKQLERLSPYLSRNEVAKQMHSYLQVHRLNGLAFCAKEHGVDDDKPPLFSHSMWLHHPLHDTQLQYAAGDIQLIAKIYSAFIQKDYIDEPKLLQQSARYIALRQGSLRAAGEGHPLLPLEILSAPSISGAKHVCLTCKRSLGISAFSNARKNCWVCRAVSVRPKEWDDDDDDYDYEGDDDEFLNLSDNDSYGCDYNDLGYDEDDYF